MPTSVGLIYSLGTGRGDVVFELEPGAEGRGSPGSSRGRIARGAGLLDVPPLASARLRMVSRYATCGLPTLAPTPNSRIMRSTMISSAVRPSRENGLAGFQVRVHAEGGVFLGQLLNRHAHLFLVGLVFGSTAS